MDLLEEELFCPRLSANIYYWHRYVDDVLCVWSGSLKLLYDFLDFLNAQYTRIKFTLELCDDQNIVTDNINSLDLGVFFNKDPLKIA